MSGKYLGYLVRSRRLLLIFFSALFLCLMVLPAAETPLYGMKNPAVPVRSLALGFGLCLAGSFLLPALMFSFVHRKSSADRWFCLPVSRRRILNTSLLAAFVGCLVLYALGEGLTALVSGSLLPAKIYLQFFLVTAVTTASLLCINTLLYLLANNIFDGVIAMILYTLLPLALLAVLSNLCWMLIAGNTQDLSDLLPFVLWLSAPGMGIWNAARLCHYGQGLLNSASLKTLYLILPLCWGALACLALQGQFVRRRAERAGQLSDGFFAYPFLIGTYTVLALLLLGAAVAGEKSLGLCFFYLVFFAMFLCVMFVYKRRIRISGKSVIFYAAAAVLTLAVCLGGFATRGFGLADRYRTASQTTTYSFSATVAASDLGQSYYNYDGQDTTLLADGGSDPLSMDSVTVYASAFLPTQGQTEEQQRAEEVFRQLRKSSIDGFYRRQKDDGFIFGSLAVVNDQSASSGSSAPTYLYSLYALPDEEQLGQIAAVGDVTVQFYSSEGYSFNLPLAEYLERRAAGTLSEALQSDGEGVG